MTDQWRSPPVLKQPHGFWWTSLCTSHGCRWAEGANPHLGEDWESVCLRWDCFFLLLWVKHNSPAACYSCLILHTLKMMLWHKKLSCGSNFHKAPPDSVFVCIIDALFASAEPESAIPDFSEHEWQCAPRAATKQPLHPHQHQLQHAGQGLPQQQGSEAAVPRYRPPSVMMLSITLIVPRVITLFMMDGLNRNLHQAAIGKNSCGSSDVTAAQVNRTQTMNLECPCRLSQPDSYCSW